MKKYSNLVPILLVIFMVLSSYSLITGITDVKREYEQLMATAREYSKKGIVVDAATYYSQALDIQDSMDVNLEIGKMYQDNDMLSQAIEWMEDTIDKFPKDSRGYEYLVELYIEDADFEACFELGESIEKYEIFSEKLTKSIDGINYIYEIDGRSYTEVGSFKDDVCITSISGIWGYASNDGNYYLENVYTQTNGFGDGVAAVIKDNEYFFIDTYGNKKMVLPEGLKPTNIGIFSEGIVPMTVNEEAGYYNTSFELLLGGFNFAGNFSEGVSAVLENDVNWFLLSKSGKKINENWYLDIKLDRNNIAFRNGRAFVKGDEGYIMVDNTNKQIGNQTYQDACVFYDSTYAAVKVNDKWGFVDSNGKIVIEPQYEKAESFSNGLASVMQGGEWGYIDMNNKMRIEPQFEDCREFSSLGRAFVFDNEEWSVLTLLSKTFE